MLMHRSKAAQATAGASLVARALPGVLALLVVLSSALLLASTAQVASASTLRPQMALETAQCSNPAPNGHCYHKTTWTTGVNGAYTTIYPGGAMNCTGCLSGRFVTDEMWFMDDTTTACKQVPSFNACFVEVGVGTFGPGDAGNCSQDPAHLAAVCVFWADLRPNQTADQRYNIHGVKFLGAYGVDLSSYTINVEVDNPSLTATNNKSNTWNVFIVIYQGQNKIYDNTGNPAQSTANNMTPNKVTIGCEEYGTDPKADNFEFENNQWRGATNNTWYYRTGEGTDGSTNAPPGPDGEWVTSPANSPTGGNYRTWDNPPA